MSWRENSAFKPSRVGSSLATTMMPLVPLSSRCTMPGRKLASRRRPRRSPRTKCARGARGQRPGLRAHARGARRARPACRATTDEHPRRAPRRRPRVGHEIGGSGARRRAPRRSRRAAPFRETRRSASVEGDPPGVDPALHRRARAGHPAPRASAHDELVEPVERIAGRGDEPVTRARRGATRACDFTCPLDLMRMSMSARS